MNGFENRSNPFALCFLLFVFLEVEKGFLVAFERKTQFES